MYILIIIVFSFHDTMTIAVPDLFNLNTCETMGGDMAMHYRDDEKVKRVWYHCYNTLGEVDQ